MDLSVFFMLLSVYPVIPAISSFSPNTDGLVLVGQMLAPAIVVIECLNHVVCLASEVLVTADGGTGRGVARDLGYLKG